MRRSAWRSARRLDVDRANEGMRVGRIEHHRMRLPGKVDITHISTLPGQETCIFEPGNRLTDTKARQ